MSEREVTIRIGAKDEASEVFGKVARNANSMKDAVNRGGRGGGGGGGGEKEETGLKRVQESLGETRGLREIIEGGAANVVGQSLANASGKAAELVGQFRKGQIDAKAMAVAIGESLPIIGGFVTAGQNIREIFTHERADLEEMTKETKRTNALLDYQRDVAEKIKQSRRETVEAIEDANAREKNAGLEGFAAEKASRDEASRKAQEHLEDDRADKLKENAKARDQQIAENDKAGRAKEISAEEHDAASRRITKAAKAAEIAINSDHDKQLAADRNAAFAEDGAARQKSYRDAYQLRDAYNEKTREQIEKSKEDELRASGKAEDIAEADRRAIASRYDAQREEIKRQLEEQKRTVNPLMVATVEDAAKKQLDALDEGQKKETAAQQEQARRRIADAKDQSRDTVAKTIADSRLEGLHAEAEMGSKVAEIEASRIEIAEKYREKRSEIEKQLRDDLQLTEAQRVQLRQVLGGLGEQEEREKRIALLKGQQFDLAHSPKLNGAPTNFVGAAAAFQSEIAGMKGRILDGASRAGGGTAGGTTPAVDQAAKDTAKSTGKAADLLNTMSTTMTTLLQIVQQSQQNNSQPLFSN